VQEVRAWVELPDEESLPEEWADHRSDFRVQFVVLEDLLRK
jgi:hypothetical protein